MDTVNPLAVHSTKDITQEITRRLGEGKMLRENVKDFITAMLRDFGLKESDAYKIPVNLMLIRQETLSRMDKLNEKSIEVGELNDKIKELQDRLSKSDLIASAPKKGKSALKKGELLYKRLMESRDLGTKSVIMSEADVVLLEKYVDKVTVSVVTRNETVVINSEGSELTSYELLQPSAELNGVSIIIKEEETDDADSI